LSEIESNFGKGSIMRLGLAPAVKVDTFSTGALTLDLALGGGIPRGRIIEVCFSASASPCAPLRGSHSTTRACARSQIYGPESSGKTTLALHCMAAAQAAGGTAALIDAEHAFDQAYAEKLGLKCGDLLLCQPDSGEMALQVVDELVRSSAVDVITVDSVAALVPQSEIQGEIGLVQLGGQARLMSQALRKLAASASKANTTIIFLNQLRSKIGVVYGSPEVTSGGNALKFYASCRMDIRRTGSIPDKPAPGESHTGIRVKVKVVKNKVAPPYRIAEFDIMFGSGISHVGCLVDAAEQSGVLLRKGAWYSYKDANLGQGREKTLAALAENRELAAEIEAAVRALGQQAAAVELVPADMDEEGTDVGLIDDDEAPLPLPIKL
jgi:recombination protein RecA